MARERRIELLYIIHAVGTALPKHKGSGVHPSSFLLPPQMKMELLHHRQSSGAPDPGDTEKPQARLFDNTADLFSAAQQLVTHIPPCPGALLTPRAAPPVSSRSWMVAENSLPAEVRDGCTLHITGTHPRLNLELQLPQILQAKPVSTLASPELIQKPF